MFSNENEGVGRRKLLDGNKIGAFYLRHLFQVQLGRKIGTAGR
jgi:hypothetical protein